MATSYMPRIPRVVRFLITMSLVYLVCAVVYVAMPRPNPSVGTTVEFTLHNQTSKPVRILVNPDGDNQLASITIPAGGRERLEMRTDRANLPLELTALQAGCPNSRISTLGGGSLVYENCRLTAPKQPNP